MCCIAHNELVEEEFANDPLLGPKEFWNSAYMKDRRQKMLRHEPPPECIECSALKVTFTPRENSFNKPFKKHFEERIIPALANPHEVLPVSVDYRVNTCNLKCVMCHPGASTSMAAYFSKNAELCKEYGVPQAPTQFSSQPNRKTETFQYLDSLFQTKQVSHAYFAGGEPLLAPHHLETLDKILEQKIPYQELSYNTNLMQSKARTEQWAQKLTKFPHVLVYCSIDATDELGAYLRVGFQQKVFDENLELLRSLPENVVTVLDVTVTSLSLFKLVELARYAIEKNISIRARTVFVNHSQFLSLGYLPMEERKRLIERYKIFHFGLPRKKQKLVQDIINVLPLVLEVPEFTEHDTIEADKVATFHNRLYPKAKKVSDWFLELRQHVANSPQDEHSPVYKGLSRLLNRGTDRILELFRRA